MRFARVDVYGDSIIDPHQRLCHHVITLFPGNGVITRLVFQEEALPVLMDLKALRISRHNTGCEFQPVISQIVKN